MQKFKPVTNVQLMLLPPSVEDFIPSSHLARVINDVVETIDVKDMQTEAKTKNSMSNGSNV